MKVYVDVMQSISTFIIMGGPATNENHSVC